MTARTSTRKDVHGWVVLDKPSGMNSTHAVSRLKRIFNAKKAGHAGTLDPLATGILPIAFGEATKTVPFVQDGEKAYRFTVRWGTETDTDDADGRIAAQSDLRPAAAEILALLPGFIGTIPQLPPSYSAIKINGERAYDLARDGEAPVLSPRPVTIHALDLLSSEPDEAVFEARCGKGTYVRAIARDLGRSLGCYGHVSALRRTRVGPSTKRMRCFCRIWTTRAPAPGPCAALRQGSWKCRASWSILAPRPGSGVASRCCCVAKTRPLMAPPMPPVAASSSPLAQSRMGS